MHTYIYIIHIASIYEFEISIVLFRVQLSMLADQERTINVKLTLANPLQHPSSLSFESDTPMKSSSLLFWP